MSSAYSDNFTSLLPIWIPFISCLIPRSFNTVLSRRCESGHPCLFPDFSGKAFNLSSLSIILAVGLLCFFCTHFGKSLYYEWMLNFVKWLFCIYRDDQLVFVFSFVMWYITFVSVEPFLWTWLWNMSHFSFLFCLFGFSLLFLVRPEVYQSCLPFQRISSCFHCSYWFFFLLSFNLFFSLVLIISFLLLILGFVFSYFSNSFKL